MSALWLDEREWMRDRGWTRQAATKVDPRSDNHPFKLIMSVGPVALVLVYGVMLDGAGLGEHSVMYW